MAALEKALATDRRVFVVAQQDPMIESPSANDLFRMGTIGQILQIMRLHNGTIKALFEAKTRGMLIEASLTGSFYSALVEPLPGSRVSYSGIGCIEQKCPA